MTSVVKRVKSAKVRNGWKCGLPENGWSVLSKLKVGTQKQFYTVKSTGHYVEQIMVLRNLDTSAIMAYLYLEPLRKWLIIGWNTWKLRLWVLNDEKHRAWFKHLTSWHQSIKVLLLLFKDDLLVFIKASVGTPKCTHQSQSARRANLDIRQEPGQSLPERRSPGLSAPSGDPDPEIGISAGSGYPPRVPGRQP